MYRIIDTERGIGGMVYDIAGILQTKKTYEPDSTRTPNSSMVVLKSSMLQAQPKIEKTHKILHNQALTTEIVLNHNHTLHLHIFQSKHPMKQIQSQMLTGVVSFFSQSAARARLASYTGITSPFDASSHLKTSPSRLVGRMHLVHWQPVENGSDGGTIISTLSFL